MQLKSPVFGSKFTELSSIGGSFRENKNERSRVWYAEQNQIEDLADFVRVMNPQVSVSTARGANGDLEIQATTDVPEKRAGQSEQRADQLIKAYLDIHNIAYKTDMDETVADEPVVKEPPSATFLETLREYLPISGFRFEREVEVVSIHGRKGIPIELRAVPLEGTFGAVRDALYCNEFIKAIARIYGKDIQTPASRN